MKLEERRRALVHLKRHPGHTDSRIARELGVAPSTVSRWRWEAGLAPAERQDHAKGRTRRKQVTARPLGEALVGRVRAASAAKRRR